MKTSIFAEGKEWEPAGEGVVRQIMGYNDDIMVVKVKFEKGAVGAVHHHIHSQVTYVESGKFEFTINGVKKIVSAGDCLYKEPDAVHGCVCLEPGMLIDCFSRCVLISWKRNRQAIYSIHCRSRLLCLQDI